MACVDIIVLNFNGRKFLPACLGALRAQTYQDFQVLFVDNASTDGSLDLIKSEFPEVRILALPENYGFCGGNNRGIEATHGLYVTLVNTDTEVTPDWLKNLVAVLENSPEIGFCASKMVRIADRSTIDTAGDVFYTHGVGGKRGNGESAQSYTLQEQIFGACAGAAIYRRSMLDKIGLLDEDFFAYDEDIDLSFRAQLSGYRCQYVPDAIVYHHVGGSFGTPSKKVLRQGRRNMLEVLLKNMPARLLLKYLPSITLYYIGGDLAYMLKGNTGAILGARWENLIRLPRTMAKRKQIQDSRKISIRDVDNLLIHKGISGFLSGLHRHI